MQVGADAVAVPATKVAGSMQEELQAYGEFVHACAR